jgi:hypothetical protein
MADYNVTPRGDKWAAQRSGASRASSLENTQAAAYNAARNLAANSGGGEVNLHGRDGQIRDKNTIAPAVDPRKTKG